VAGSGLSAVGRVEVFKRTSAPLTNSASIAALSNKPVGVTGTHPVFAKRDQRSCLLFRPVLHPQLWIEAVGIRQALIIPVKNGAKITKPVLGGIRPFRYMVGLTLFRR
jgi:hypothetical protein